MANTYTQINVHSVFSVKGNHSILNTELRLKLFQYIHGILKNMDLFPIAVNGWKDHVHTFFELKPDISLSKSMEIVKTNSSKWINENRFVPGKFEWQRGFGAFSHSRSQRDVVIKYIMNQEEYHRSKENTFRKEYLSLLNQSEIDYDPRYLFEFY